MWASDVILNEAFWSYIGIKRDGEDLTFTAREQTKNFLNSPCKENLQWNIYKRFSVSDN